MAEPFLAEIRMMSFAFPPKGWARCDGQLLPINQNQALFSLLGTTYGGDGRVNFALPDLRGRTPIHAGNGHVLGERGGAAGHTLTVGELPAHDHTLRAAAGQATTPDPSGGVLAASAPTEQFRPPTHHVPVAAGTVAAVGGSQVHTNLQPFLAIGFCIALQGIFPSPT